METTTFIIAELADITIIRDLAERSWTYAYRDILSEEQIDYMLNTMYSTEELSRQLNDENYCYYLIKVDRENAGFLGFERNYEPHTTKLHRLYLLKEYQGKGLGKKALTFLKVISQENNDQFIILNVNKHNHAKKMYESQGFKVYDEKIIDIGQGFVMDDYLMKYCL